jgi:hypothetical protein
MLDANKVFFRHNPGKQIPRPLKRARDDNSVGRDMSAKWQRQLARRLVQRKAFIGYYRYSKSIAPSQAENGEVSVVARRFERKCAGSKDFGRAAAMRSCRVAGALKGKV